MHDLADTDVLILGLGASGLAMARWCVRHGARVRVWDSRPKPPMGPQLQQDCPGAVFFSGELDPAMQLEGMLILKSPGLSPADERVAPLLKRAAAHGATVSAELGLFAHALRDLRQAQGYEPQVLAITGTNGKTTTTRLTGLLVQRSGRRVAVAGNIGPTLLDTLSEALQAQADAGEPMLPEVWVLELSSFQLDGIEGFEPDAAVVLNVTEDHLDWHGDMDRYVQAKSRVYGPEPRQQDDGSTRLSSTVMVINRDDPVVSAMVPEPMPLKGIRGRSGKALARQTISFGLDIPTRPGDFGVVRESGMAWLVRALPSESPERARPEAQPPALVLQRLMPADALRIRGRHNAANALAALALACSLGCPMAPMLHGLREYAGEPHRVSFVLRAAEVDVYDDSKGTNVGATVAAIQGLGADLEPARLVLLLGGDGKGQNFAPLREPVARHARAVALYGRDAGAIESALQGVGLLMCRHEDLRSAARWALAQAHPGDAVVLSPACASLDQFRDYRHRAEVFVAEAQAWAQEQGVAA